MTKLLPATYVVRPLLSLDFATSRGPGRSSVQL